MDIVVHPINENIWSGAKTAQPEFLILSALLAVCDAKKSLTQTNSRGRSRQATLDAARRGSINEKCPSSGFIICIPDYD